MPVIKADSVPAQQATTFSMKDIENYAKSLIHRARQQAEMLLTEAQQQGEEIRKQQAEEGRQEGFAQGLQQGIEAGRKQGHQQALNENKQKLADLTAALTEVLGQVEAQRQMLEAEAVTDVIELAISIARRVTKRQAEIDPGVLAANLDEAMKLVTSQSDLRIAIHPYQRKTLQSELPKLQLQWPSLQHVELIDDASVGVGGCRVYTRQGMVDADLDGQLDRVVADLLPGRKDGAAD
jgi:flagellar assembly protein FliH